MMIKKMVYTIVLITMLLMVVYSTYADEINSEDGDLSFELLDRNTGLSNLAISSIVQDKYGYIWIGTQGGLNRYDGHKMIVYRNDPFNEKGLIHNLIQSMYYDENNHVIWIGTYQGVSQFDIHNNTFTNYDMKDGLSDDIVTAINQDGHGNIWLGTMNGLTILRQDGSMDNYAVEGDVIRDILITDNNTVFIGTYNGLYYYDGELDRLTQYEVELPSPLVMTIKEFDIGTLTLGLWDGGVVELDYVHHVSKIISLSDNRVYSILKTKQGDLWVGTWGGGLFGIHENGEMSHYTPENSKMESPVVYALHEDHSGIMWIGTNGGGLYKSNPRRRNLVQINYDPDNDRSLSQGKITELFEDQENNIWVALYDNGLNVLLGGSNKIVKFESDENILTGLNDNLVIDMIQDGPEHLLLATGKGIERVNTQTFEFRKWSIIPDDPIIYALEKVGDEYWVGTYGQGLYRYNIITDTLKHFSEESDELSNNLIYDILYDSKGQLWVATNSGLNLLENGQSEFVQFYHEPGVVNKLPNDVVQVIYEDSSNRIWIGTDGGGIAVVLEDNSFKSYTEREGLSSNGVVGILEDDENRIIVSTSDGITSINTSTDEMVVFTPNDGIGGWEFNTGHVKTQSGNLLFGGLHGITNIPSHYENDKNHVPHMYITNVELYQNTIKNDTLHYNDTNYTFSSKENSFTFEFVAIDYDNPETTNYVYKLEGFDEEWIYNGNETYAKYSNLQKGEYVFKVFAETSRRNKSDIVSMRLQIKPHWSKTIFAYVVYMLLLMVMIFVIIKFREFSVVGEKNAELASLIKKLAVVNDDLEQLSTRDGLTDLFNRRYFDHELNEKLLIAKRSNTHITLMMIDIDHFKDINDQLGHVAGDHLLIDIAKVLKDVLPRKTDFIARYGGDEFAVVLYDTEEKGSLIVADHLIKSVDEVYVQKSFTKDEISVSISIGLLCVIPSENLTVEKMVRVADEGLYTAKQNGRHQYMIQRID